MPLYYAMPIVYACIVPSANAVDEASRTAGALRRVAEELRALEPETALVVTSRGGAQRSTMGVVTAPQIEGIDTDAELAERVLAEARASEVHVVALPRWDGGLDGLAALGEALARARLLAIATARLSPREHFELGRAIARALEGYERHVAIVCAAGLSRATAPDEPGRAFDKHYRHAVEEWDVKWLVALDSETRRRAAEDAVAQTAVLMGALSGSRIQPRVLSYEAPDGAGELVAAIDVLGPRRKGK